MAYVESGNKLMRVVLKIGYQQVLLPNDTGLQTLLKALSQGILCDYRSYGQQRVETAGDRVRVSVDVVPPGTPVVAPERPEAADGHPVVGTIDTLQFPGERPRLGKRTACQGRLDWGGRAKKTP